MMNGQRGSVWRKWDLHVHTPASILHNNYEGSNEIEKWERYLSKLSSIQDISVIGLTDYFSIDGYKKIIELNQDDPEKLTNIDLFLPNVELRILPVTDDNSAINIHVIFSPDEDIINNLDSLFFSNLEFSYNNSTYKCTRNDLIRLGRAYLNDDEADVQRAYRAGMEQFKTDINTLQKVFKKNKKLRNNSIIIVSNSGNDGASGIQHSSLAATRQEIYRFADAIFSGNPADRNYFLGHGSDDKSEIFRKYGLLKSCVHGSDAHELSKICEPDLGRFTWIKADTTFEGLKQIIYEPEARVRIQKENPEGNYKKAFFSKVTLNNSQIFNKEKPQFSENEISLNRDLIAIIGGRGTGKSLLLDAIKKTFHKKDSFMGNARYSHIKENLDFDINYTKVDGSDNIYKLPDINNLDYLHVQQGEVKEIVQETQRLDEEVKKLIGIGDYKTESALSDRTIQTTIQTLINDKEWLDQVDEVGNKIHNTGFQKQQRKKYQELITTITTKENEELISLYRKNTALLDFLSGRIVMIESLIEELKTSEENINFLVDDINTLSFGEFLFYDSIPSPIEEFVRANNSVFLITYTGNHAGEFTTLSISKEMTDEQKHEINKLTNNIYKEEIEDIYNKSKLLRGEIDNIKFESKILESEALKEMYVEELKQLENENEEIKNKFVEQKITEDVSTLLRKVDQYQTSIDEINSTIKIIEDRRKNMADNYSTLFIIATRYRSQWEEAKKNIEQKWLELKNSDSDDSSPKQSLINKLFTDIEISAFINFNSTSFYSEIEDCLDMKKFRRKESVSSIERMENAFNVNDVDSFLLLTNDNKVIDIEEESKVSLSEFLNRKDYFVSGGEIKLLNILFLEANIGKYIQVLSKSTYKGKDPNELSVGQRGTFYICLKLATDTFGSPFIFDQPEDDLDNEFIMKELVPIFREIKNYRQVIIVTHNANLCVNADAEQVIVASNDNEIISYTSGALENSIIRESVYNILEGGRDAFLNRERKYNFKS